MTAIGKTYHKEHFVCTECRRPFGEDGFHEKVYISIITFSNRARAL